MKVKIDYENKCVRLLPKGAQETASAFWFTQNEPQIIIETTDEVTYVRLPGLKGTVEIGETPGYWLFDLFRKKPGGFVPKFDRANLPTPTDRLAPDRPVDSVNHPKHYTAHPSGIECIRVTEHHNFCVGNALKYLWRAGLKTEEGKTDTAKTVADLRKAVWYLNREIARIDKK